MLVLDSEDSRGKISLSSPEVAPGLGRMGNAGFGIITMSTGAATATTPDVWGSRFERWGKILGFATLIFGCGMAYATLRSDLKHIQDNMASKEDVREVRRSLDSTVLVLGTLIDQLVARKLVTTDLKTFLPPKMTLKQGDRDIIQAVANADPRRDGDHIVYTVSRASAVVAGFDGVVGEIGKSDGRFSVRIHARGAEDVLAYAGLSGLRVIQGERVTGGDMIGAVEPGVHSPETARVTVQFLRGGKSVPASAAIRLLYAHPGQRVFDNNCAGCHEKGGAGVILIQNGRLRKSGIAATARNIADKVRTGGEGMPPFGIDTLSDEDVNQTAEFLLQVGASNSGRPSSMAMAMQSR